MASVLLFSLISVFLVSLISFVGILGLMISHKRLDAIIIYLVSFSTGALFGDAFIHLLPESARKNGFNLTVSVSVLAGIFLFFILEKVIHWRHCHLGDCEHHAKKINKKRFAYLFGFGDGLHNFIDGMIIAASYIASVPIGIATTIAVVLHEIPQEVGDFAIFVHGGFSRFKALMANFMIGLLAILGAIVALWLSGFSENLANVLIPFAAGGFIYVAGSDLIPELHKEVKLSRSVMQVIAFVLGILIMMLLLNLG